LTQSISSLSTINVYDLLNLDLSYRDQTNVVLELLNNRYRDEITLQLIKEDEERNKKKGKTTKTIKQDKEEEIEELDLDVDDYDEAYWQSFEFHKYYFEDENVLDSLIVIPNIECKKKKKKTKKLATTRHTSDVSANDYPYNELKNNFIDNIEDTETPIPTQVEDEIKNEVESTVIEKVEPEVNNKEEEYVPEIPIQETHKPIVSEEKSKQKNNVQKEKNVAKKKKKANRANRLANKKAITDYEEVKEKAVQFYSHLTETRITSKQNLKPKKKSHKKRKKSPNKDPPPNPTNEDNKQIVEEPIHEVTNKQNEEAYNPYENEVYEGKVDEQAGNLNDEQGFEEDDEYEEEEYYGDREMSESYDELILAPYVGSSSESEFFDKLNHGINTFISAIEAHNKKLRPIANEVQQAIRSLVTKQFKSKFLFNQYRTKGYSISVWISSIRFCITYK